MSVRAASRRVGWALGVSVLLHAVVIWRLRETPPPPVTVLTEPLELEIVETEPPAPVEAVRSPRPGSRPPTPKAPISKSPQSSPPAVEEDVPRLALPSLSLLPKDAPSDVIVREAPRLTPQVPGAELHAPRVPKDLIGETVSESLGRGKVDRGLVHPYFANLGKALLKVWDPDRAVSRKGLKGFGEQFVENNRTFHKIWTERAAQYAKTGSPLAAGTQIPRDGAYGPDPAKADKMAMREYAREQWKSARRALIRVTQDVSGRLLDIELVSPSNDPTVDKEGMADVRTAAEKLPAPPAEAVGLRKQIVSLWQFELIISVSPPIPSFTFEFDEALKFIDARMPLDRRLYKRVRLISVN